MFICGAESQFLSAGAWLLRAKGGKSFQYEPDRVGGIKGTQPESLLEVPPRVASAAPSLQGNVLQRGHAWTAAGIIKDPPKDSCSQPSERAQESVLRRLVKSLKGTQASGGVQPGRRFSGVCASVPQHVAHLHQAWEPDPVCRESCCVLRSGVPSLSCDWCPRVSETERGSGRPGRGTHSRAAAQFPHHLHSLGSGRT